MGVERSAGRSVGFLGERVRTGGGDFGCGGDGREGVGCPFCLRKGDSGCGGGGGDFGGDGGDLGGWGLRLVALVSWILVGV